MELTKEYARAYTEVLVVLKNLTQEEYAKIPKSKIELYEEYKDSSYSFSYNVNVELDKQISFEAKNILANLFLNYIATQEDRNEFFEKERKEIYEKECQKGVNLNPLFENKKETSNTENINKVEKEYIDNTSIAISKKENFFRRIISRIMSIFFEN